MNAEKSTEKSRAVEENPLFSVASLSAFLGVLRVSVVDL